jgi:hypothetical protein
MGPILDRDQWKLMATIEGDLWTAFLSNQAIGHSRTKAFFPMEEGYNGTAGSMIEIGKRSL